MKTKTTKVTFIPPTPNPAGCVCDWEVALVGYGQPGCPVVHPMTWKPLEEKSND